MFGSEILDVAIGLMFVYLIMSLICSSLRELAEGWFKTRAMFLHVGLRQLLRDDTGADLVRMLHEHPSVYALYQGDYQPIAGSGTVKWFRRLLWKTNLPAYIPASNFAVALLDIAARGEPTQAPQATSASPKLAVDDIRARIAELKNPQVQRAVLAAIDMAGGDITVAQKNIEAWYNGAMDRVSGWYKRRTQAWLFSLGTGLAVWFNVNTLTIARYLYHDETARAALVANAESATRDSSLQRLPLDTLLVRLDQLDLPIGWSYGVAGERPRRTPAGSATATAAAVPGVATGAEHVTLPALRQRLESATRGQWLTAVAGWLTTGLAISLGAPFWFDLLNKVMVIRSTVKPREKSREEGSEDRRPPKARGDDAV